MESETAYPSSRKRHGSFVAPMLTHGPGSWLDRIYELPNSSARLKSMEGLRGLAVLLVFFVHFDSLFGKYVAGLSLLATPTHFLGLIGNAGVDVFFVLSGYLIYGALIRHSTGTAAFLIRRVERIYPTFLAVFGLYIVLSFVFPQESRIHGRSLPNAGVYIAQNLLLLPGMFNIDPIITVAWSLSYEMFFYVASALMIGAARMWAWRSRARILLFTAACFAYLALCFSSGRASHIRVLMFVSGVLLYEALLSKRFIAMLSRSGEVMTIGGLVLSFTGLYMFDARPLVFTFLGDPKPYKTLMLSVSIFWCVAYCLAFEGALKRFFVWRPLRYLGNMSYSYYLIHGVTMEGVALIWTAAVRPRVGGVAAFALALPVAFSAAWVTATILFYRVERPLSLCRRAPRPAAKAVAAHSVHG